MNKKMTLPLMLIATLGFFGCRDTESIRSENMYITVSERKMPYYCRQEAAKHLGVPAAYIFTHPVEFEQGSKLVYGKYSIDEKNLEEFVCVFNSDDTYAGIKIQHSKVKNKLCYRK